MGAAVVGFGGLEHAEAVVVFGGEDHIFHARVGSGFGPTVGVEAARVEGAVQLLVVELVLLVGGALAVDPGFAADAPGLDHAPLAIDAPVGHEAELEVLPFFEAMEYQWVGLVQLVVGSSLGRLVLLGIDGFNLLRWDRIVDLSRSREGCRCGKDKEE